MALEWPARTEPDAVVRKNVGDQPHSHGPRRAALLLALFLSIGCAAIAARNRVPWSDEGQFSSSTWNLVHHGFLGNTVMETAGTGYTRIDQHTYWVMPLFLAGQALWYLIFPASIFWTRAFSMAWEPVAAWGLYQIVRRLDPGRSTATIAACLFVLSYIFIDNASFGRPDLMCCALGLCGIAAYLSLRERSVETALMASNSLVAAAGMTHPNGIFYFFGLLLVVVWCDRKSLRLLSVLAAALPYMVLGLLWGIYIAQDPAAFLDQMRTNGSIGRWPNTWNPLEIIALELGDRYAHAFGLVTRGAALLKSVTLAIWIAGVTTCLTVGELRRRKGTRLLLALLAAFFAMMCIFNQKLTYYLVHILPWYMALLAIAIEWYWFRFPAWRTALTVVVAGLIALETGGILLRARTRSYIEKERTMVAWVRSHARPSDRIVGSASLLYGLGFDARLKDDPYLGLRSGRKPDMVIIEPLFRDLYDAWDRVAPDDMHAIRNRLAEYKPAWNNGTYEIYLNSER
jgi:hypothetical protein